MKKLLLFLALFVGTLLQAQITGTGIYCNSYLQGGSTTCGAILPLCSGDSFQISVNAVTVPSTNNYNCLGTQPNPFWSYIQIGNSGNIVLELMSNPVLDIDFILWGPFSSVSAAQSACGNLGQPPLNINGAVEDCSYSAGAVEQVDITSAIAGEVYVLLVTNFSGQTTTVQLTQIGGTGSLACNSPGNGQIQGTVYNDANNNCVQDSTELGLPYRLLHATPGDFYMLTDSLGQYSMCARVDTYEIKLMADTSLWQATCPPNLTRTVIVASLNDSITGQDFGIQVSALCSRLQVDLSHLPLRPCFANNIQVSYQNQVQATADADSTYIIVTLDTALTVTGASLPYVALGGNQFGFDIGNLAPGDFGQITINTFLSCSTLVGTTLCNQAAISGLDSCGVVVDTSAGNIGTCTGPWDRSSLQVNGYCVNDSIIRFVIMNTGDPGNGDMQCFRPVRVFIDTSLYLLDSIMISGGDTVVYEFPANGYTWILEADQHPLHPGNSHPNAHVELCGDSSLISQNWTPGVPAQFGSNDTEAGVDIDCSVTVGSYDPNDKRGYPLGLGMTHLIAANTDLEYIIRFQNTGTASAVNVEIRDVLSEDFDITSIVLGAASHPYRFTIEGQRSLIWHFDNIMLPDSNSNEPASHGFISFKVQQQPDLPEGTLLENAADIYFDFNAPIRTNNSTHLIGDEVSTWVVLGTEITSNALESNWDLSIFPNPTEQLLTLRSNAEMNSVAIYSTQGQQLQVWKNIANPNQIELNLSAWPAGMYWIEINGEKGRQLRKVVKMK